MGMMQVSVNQEKAKIFDTVSIVITPAAEDDLHDLEYGVGSVRRTLGKDLEETEFLWVLPDLTQYFGGALEGTVTIYCARKKDGRTYGYASCELQVSALVNSTPTVEPDTVRIGESVTIRTNRIHPDYNHRISYLKAADAQPVIIAENVADSCSWTAPKELIDFTKGELAKLVTIRCETFRGAEPVIGTDVPDSVVLSVVCRPATRLSVAETEAVVGKSVTVLLNAEDDRYVHDVEFSIDGNVLAVLEQIPGGSYQWTVPECVLSYISGTEGKVSAFCATWAGETYIGENVTEIPVKVEQTDSVRPVFDPTVTAENHFTLSLGDSSDVFLKGESRIKVSYKGAKASAGAQIAQCVTEVMGERLIGEEVTTANLIAVSGTLVVNCTATDTRGFSRTVQKFIYVDPYKRPQILGNGTNGKAKCLRCDADGNPNRKGTGLLIRGSVVFHKVYIDNEQSNFAFIGTKVNEKSIDAEELNNAQYFDDTNIEIVVPGVYLDPGKAHRVTLTIMDAVGGISSYVVPVPPTFATYHVPKGGRGFTLGGYHDPSKVNVFDCLFDAHGRVQGLGGLPEMTSSNRTEPGAYAVADATKLGLEQASGVLQVWNGEGQTDDKTLHRKQKFIRADSEIEYQRSLTRATTEDAWVEEPWKSKTWE